MRVFDYEDYRLFLKDWIAARPKGGRGILGQWAASLSVHSTHLSHVLAGKKDLSIETAHQLATLIGLTESEQDHFFLLVLEARAGTASLRTSLKRKIEKSRKQANKIPSRLDVKSEIPPEAKTIFYSSWIYSAIKNLLALRKFESVDSIADSLGISKEVAESAIQFMLDHGICRRDGSLLVPGNSRTHIGPDSPLLNQHLRNWRNLALHNMNQAADGEIYFSFPMNLSKKDVDKIREELLKVIERVNGIVGPSPSETVQCLNIDFFSILHPSARQ